MARGVGRRKQAERQERIDRILGAGRRLFLEKGYLGATVRDIALEAELSTGTLYFYFKGKDEIYGRICEEAFHILTGLLRRAAEQADKPPLERLDALAAAYVKFYTAYPDYFDILSFRDMGFKKVGLPADLVAKLDRLSVRAVAMVDGVITEGIRTGDITTRAESIELTMTLWAGIEGLFSLDKRGYLKQCGLDLQEMVKVQNHHAFKGLKDRT